MTLTKAQTEIVGLINKTGQMSIDDFRDRIDDLRILLERGYLQLKVEMNEWGISFELVSNQELATIRQHL